MTKRLAIAMLPVLLAACASPGEPDPAGPILPTHWTDGSLKIAALEYAVGDLSDPAELAKYSRADLLIVQPWQFWHSATATGAFDRLRNANPEQKIIAYFRSKVVRTEWAAEPRESHAYQYDLYQAGAAHLARTTTGDTLSDWPNALVYDYLDPAVRTAMLDIFAAYQGTHGNTFDGIYWDYFGTRLWIGPGVTGMEGEPDLDGDGIAHWDDADELAAFLAGQEAWVRETRARFGEGFIQIANGNRALEDSTFAGLVDGMYYELFPTIGFAARDFETPLDPARPNNLWAAARWPRTRNGGPWLIPAYVNNIGGFTDQSGTYRPVNPGDLLRVLALLTGTTSLHHDGSGQQRAGLPSVELDLGAPLGPPTVVGARYTREFQRGSVRMTMIDGTYPVPFTYYVRDAEGQNIQVLDPPYALP